MNTSRSESSADASDDESTMRNEPVPGPSTPPGSGRADDLAPVLEALRTFVPKEQPTNLDRAASAVEMLSLIHI